MFIPHKFNTDIMKISIFQIIFFSITAVSVFGQPIRAYNYDGLMRGGELSMFKKDYYNAVDLYEKAYKERKSPDLALQIANLHYILRDIPKAENWYKRALIKDKDMTMPEAHFALGRIYKMNGKYEDAAAVFQKFITMAEDGPLRELAKTELKGIDMASKMPEQKKLIAENAGKAINCLQSDFAPVYDKDGNLYFTTFNRDSVIRLNGKEGDYFTKIYMASNGPKGLEKPVQLSAEINRENYHTGNATFSSDGTKMFFTRAELDGNEVLSSKIYVATKIEGQWSNATELTKINGNFLSKHPSVGELYGREVLFFVSNMTGSLGGFDIFYSNLNGSGDLGEPINLGKKINTIGDEVTPFYKNGTLYFSSTGHPSLGGFDVFSANWDGVEWTEPKNLGRVYNSVLDDLYYTVSNDGLNGVLASNREGTKSVKSKTCCEDIYFIKERKLEIDLNLVVMDKKAEIKGAQVELVELVGKSKGTSTDQVNEENGKFTFPLFPDKSYRVFISKEGFITDSFDLNTVGLTEAKAFEKKLTLKAKAKPVKEEYETITINQAIRLNNIYYDYDDDKILPDAEADLEYLIELYNKYPTLVLELGSHTDSRGKDDYNRELSQRRAESAKNWLVNRGVSADRIKAVGYGESVLLNKCKNGVKCNDAEHRINRRTEFKIVSGPTSIQIKKTVIKGTNKEVLPPDNKKTNTPKTNSSGDKTSQIQIKDSDIIPTVKKSDIQPVAKLPQMKFETKTVDFGIVKKGEKKSYSYKFTNSGNAPLVVEIVSGCECTTIEWTRGEIPPGGKGTIDIIYDTKDEKLQEYDKVIDILANTKPKVINCTFKAKVVQ